MKLGKIKSKENTKTLDKVDLAIYVMDVEDIDDKYYGEFVKELRKRDIPYMTVINKIDMVSEKRLKEIKNVMINERKLENIVFASVVYNNTISSLTAHKRLSGSWNKILCSERYRASFSYRG